MKGTLQIRKIGYSHGTCCHYPFLPLNWDLGQEMVNKRRRKIRKTWGGGGGENARTKEWVNNCQWGWQNRIARTKAEEGQRLKVTWGRSETEADMTKLRDWSCHEEGQRLKLTEGAMRKLMQRLKVPWGSSCRDWSWHEDALRQVDMKKLRDWSWHEEA